MVDRKAILAATAIGLTAQIAMVVVGHYVPFIRDKVFALGGMTISLVTGFLYVRMARGTWSNALAGGAFAGGACALFGIALCVALKDAPANVLVIGTASSVVTGLIGATVRRLVA